MGIVLGFLVLAYLPAILSAGALLAVAAVLVASGGALLYWLYRDQDTAKTVIWLVVVVLAAIPFLHRYRKLTRIRDLQRQIAQRRDLGYETVELEALLLVATRAAESKSVLEARARRRALGYPDVDGDA